MLRPQKEAIVERLRQQLSESQAVVLADYRGIRAGDMGRLRHQLRAAGVEFHVVKNSLVKRALSENGVDVTPELTTALLGPTALAYTTSDEVTLPMKLVRDSGEELESLEIKGGLLEGRFVSAEEVIELAQLPGRTELMALLVGTLQSPLTGIMSILQTLIGQVVSGLEQIAEQKEADSTPAAES